MKKNRNRMEFGKIWALICIPIVSLILNIILSEAQELYGFTCIAVSTVFLFCIVAIIYLGFSRINSVFNKRIIAPKINAEIKALAEDIKNRLVCEHVDGIVSELTLSQIERNTTAKEIWLASNDLNTEVAGYCGGYIDVVQRNLDRGIVYRIFYPKMVNVNAMRVEQMMRAHNNHPNFHCYELDDDFFFLVAGIDFTIYDPYETHLSGRTGYLGVMAPDSDEMYAIKVNNDLVDSVASKLLSYIN